MSYKHLLVLGLDELSPDSAKSGRLNRSYVDVLNVYPVVVI
jgi:hypothetical protein